MAVSISMLTTVLCFILMTLFFILVYLNHLFYHLNLFLKDFQILLFVTFPFPLENLKHLYFKIHASILKNEKLIEINLYFSS